MNEFNNQDKPARGAAGWAMFIFFWWLNEWKSKDKWLSFFFVCQAEGERGRKDKKWCEMCAALSFLPRTEVSGGLIFLTAVRPGRGAETVRGSCFLPQTPAPPDVAFDPARLPRQTTPPPPPSTCTH